MADWPQTPRHKTVISSLSVEALGQPATAAGTGLGASATWPSANLGIYVPFTIAAPYLVKLVWWANGATASGNVDCGVYSQDGTLLFNAGSTAQAGTSVVQSVTLGSPYLLSPGSYYMTLALSATAGTTIRSSPTAVLEQCWGMAQQASMVPLAATATLATIGQTCLPLFGIASTATI